MVDSGRNYVSQQSQFIHSLWDLSAHFRDDPDVVSSLNKLIPALQEMNKFQNILLDQASRTVLKNIQTFIKRYVVCEIICVKILLKFSVIHVIYIQFNFLSVGL